MTVKSLYTIEDVKNERLRLYHRQFKLDPIINKLMDFNDTVCDHDHVTQHCRGALHRQTNAFEGLVFNAYKRCLSWVTDEELPWILRNLADYLEQDHTKNPYHTGWMKRVKTDFNKLSVKQKDNVLNLLGCKTRCTNDTQRKLQFSKLTKDRNLGYNTILAAIEAATKNERK